MGGRLTRRCFGILFGLICLLTPGVAVEVFVILFAAYMLVDGVFAIISGIKAARNGERWGLLILEGIVDLAAGAVAVLWPAITLVALIWLVAMWAIVSGALMLDRRPSPSISIMAAGGSRLAASPR